MHYYILYIVIFMMPDATSCTLHDPCVLLEGLKKIIGLMAITEVGIWPVLDWAPDATVHRSQNKWTDFNNEASE